MSKHINKNGQFQSDKFPNLDVDKIVLSFKDPAARKALKEFAFYTEDDELGEDIQTRLNTIPKGDGG